MHSGTLKSPKKEPLRGIQLPKRQSQSIGELSVCIVAPSLSSPAVLPVKEASLIEVRWRSLSRNSTEPEIAALLSMKSTPAMESDSLFPAKTTPPYCGCEERAG